MPSASEGGEANKAGSKQPSRGDGLTNDRLAAALRKKTVFSREEWAAFGITDLRINDFIKVDDAFFQPVADQLSYRTVESGAVKQQKKIKTFRSKAEKAIEEVPTSLFTYRPDVIAEEDASMLGSDW